MEKRKVSNSFDVAKEHGNVWIHSLGGRDYRDGKLAWWAVVAPNGKQFIVDQREKIYLADPRKYHVFSTFDDATEWCEKHYRVLGWKRDKFGGYHPSETAHDRPCGRRMSKDQGRWTSFSVCDKLSVDGGECNFHRSFDARNATKRAARIEKENALNERSTSGRQIANDAIDALEKESIKSKPYVNSIDSSFIYTGEVIVHAEDVLKMVREIRHLREMLGR